MATVGFHVFVGITGGIELGAELVVGLDEEVRLADANPQEGGLLGEVGSQLGVYVLIDLGMSGFLLGAGADSSGEHAGVVEHIRVVEGDVQRVEAAHGQTTDGAALLLCYSAIAAVDELHNLRESALKGAFHGLGQAHGRVHITVGILQRSSLAGNVAIGEHHNHGLGLAAGDEVVKDLGGTALGDPGVFVTANTVEHIQHGILGLGGLVTGRSVHGQTTVKTGSLGRIPNLGNGAVRNLVDGVEVAALALGGNQQHAGEAGHVTVHPHVVRVNLAHAVYTESVVIHVRSHHKRSGILPHAAFPLLEHTHAGSVEGHLVAVKLHFPLLGGKEISGHFHLDGLGSQETERDGTVFVNHGRLHGRASEQGLLGVRRQADGQCGQCDK